MTEASAWPWSTDRASSSFAWMVRFISASSPLRCSSACHSAWAFASSAASLASARRLLLTALLTARSACHTAR